MLKGLGLGMYVFSNVLNNCRVSERTRALNSTTESACVFSPLGFSAVLGSQSAALAMPRASKTLLDSSSEVRKLGKHIVLNYGTQKHIQWSSQMFCTPPLSLSRHKCVEGTCLPRWTWRCRSNRESSKRTLGPVHTFSFLHLPQSKKHIIYIYIYVYL